MQCFEFSVLFTVSVEFETTRYPFQENDDTNLTVGIMASILQPVDIEVFVTVEAQAGGDCTRKLALNYDIACSYNYTWVVLLLTTHTHVYVYRC